MNIPKVHTFAFAAIMAVVGSGLMQGAEHGSFHLTKQVFWGRVSLQPGDYKIYIPDASLDRQCVLVQGNGKTVFELPMYMASVPLSDSNYLKLSEVGGAYFVTKFEAGAVGKTFDFHAPKATRQLQQADAMDVVLKVAVNKEAN